MPEDLHIPLCMQRLANLVERKDAIFWEALSNLLESFCRRKNECREGYFVNGLEWMRRIIVYDFVLRACNSVCPNYLIFSSSNVKKQNRVAHFLREICWKVPNLIVNVHQKVGTGPPAHFIIVVSLFPYSFNNIAPLSGG